MYKLTKHIFILLFLMAISYTSFGQVNRPTPVFRRPPSYQQRVIKPTGFNKIDAVQETYMRRRLNLSSEESDKFWPLYRRYRDALKEVRRKKRLNNSNAQADGTDQIQKELFYESELVNIRKYYTDEFLKILPPDKVSQIFKSEREFTDELIKQLHERSVPAKN
jgi:hypothetical protein